MSETQPPSTPDFARLRREYQQRSLTEQDIGPDPIGQFLLWLHEAVTAGANDLNAMTLATSTSDGVPCARVVLLKDINREGLAFFTNYSSRKGRELDANPRACVVFYWPELERQVRIEGHVSRTSDAESDAYFASRPPDARIGSAASPQSQPVASRQVLEDAMQSLRDKYPTGEVPRPPHWGGYRLRPIRFEFWQGRASRVHDRIEYALDAEGQWKIRRLAP